MPDHGAPAERGGGRQNRGCGKGCKAASDGGKGCCAQSERENQRYRAISADPAILHDGERLVAILAAAKTIRHVAQAILMQSACRHRLNCKRQQRRHQRIGVESKQGAEDYCCGQGNQQAGEGKGPRDAGKLAVIVLKERRRHGNTAQKSDGARGIACVFPNIHPLPAIPATASDVFGVVRAGAED